MAEEKLLVRGPVVITTARAVFGGTTYPLASITSVRAVRDAGSRYAAIFVALVAAASGALALKADGPTPVVAICGAAVAACALWAVYGVVHRVVIVTAGGEVRALQDRNQAIAAEVVAALNDAIVKRG